MLRYIDLVKKTDELNQFIYFKNVLTTEWKSEYLLYWWRGYDIVSTENKNVMVSSKSMEIRFDQGDLLKS